MHRRWITNKNHHNSYIRRKDYTKARNKVKNLIRKAKREYEKSIARRAAANPKVFWSHVRGKLKAKSGIAPLLQNVNDKSSTKFEDQEKANILQQQFVGVFTQEPKGELPAFDRKTDTLIENIIIIVFNIH